VSILERVLGGVIAAIVLSLVGSDHATTLIPTPIGVGAKYRLSAAPPAVLRGVPVRSMRCRDARHWASAHVEVFAARRVVILPAGIGMAKPVQRNGAYVTGPRICSSLRVRTTLAGRPIMTEPSGNSLPSVTSAPAPTRQCRPIFAPFNTTDWMPISE